MIELRWYYYMSNVNPETYEGFAYPSKYKKLQYRVVTDQDNVSPEWIDVPEVFDNDRG